MMPSERKREVKGQEGWKECERSRYRVCFDEIFTIFIDNIPEKSDASWLRSMFKECGVILDAYIPAKKRRYTNTKFGFIRFKSLEEAERAIKAMNGAWKHGCVLRVNLANFGWRRGGRLEEKKRPGVQKTVKVGAAESWNVKVSGRSFRDAVLGVGKEVVEQPEKSEMVSPQGALVTEAVEAIVSRVAFIETEVARLQQVIISAMAFEAINSRVAVLEREVARLQQASTYAMSVGQSKKDSEQMEEVSGGEGGIADLSGVGISGLTDVIMNRRDREESSMHEVAGSDRATAVTPKKVEMGESVGSFSGDWRPEGSGEGNGSLTGVINVINSRDVWESKKEDQTSAFSKWMMA